MKDNHIAECIGSATIPVEESGGLSLEAAWTGKCPACGHVFELGYAGFLPAHVALQAPTPPSPPRRSSRRSQPTVGERIRARREELELSQSQLAGNGVSRTYVSLIERGRRNPSAKALRALAPLLSVSVHWLETGETDPAEELAALVLSQPVDGASPRSRRLARRVLRRDPDAR